MENIGTSNFTFGTDVPKETVTLAVPVIQTDHAYIHQGLGFELSGTFAANGTNKAVIAFNPPADTAATVTIDMTAANADLVYTAKETGTDGNLITVVHVNPGAASQPLTVTENGKIITVSLATAANSAISSTATLVAAAVNAASSLVTVTAEGSGAGVVNAVASTALTGGKVAVYIHFRPVFITADAALVTLKIWENATYTGTAATLVAECLNRVRDTASRAAITATLAGTVTTTSATNLKTLTIRGTATGSNKTSDTGTAANEIVFKPGLAYLIEFTPAAATAIDYDLFWYEEASA